jgi:NADP-dependent 3-hydroxy acid dehydrogenase YdfG
MPITPKGTVTARTSRPFGSASRRARGRRVGQRRDGLDRGGDRLEPRAVEREAVDQRLGRAGRARPATSPALAARMALRLGAQAAATPRGRRAIGGGQAARGGARAGERAVEVEGGASRRPRHPSSSADDSMGPDALQDALPTPGAAARAAPRRGGPHDPRHRARDRRQRRPGQGRARPLRAAGSAPPCSCATPPRPRPRAAGGWAAAVDLLDEAAVAPPSAAAMRSARRQARRRAAARRRLRAASAADTDLAALRRQFDLNLATAATVVRALLPAMLRRGGGTIVGVAAGQARRGGARAAAYAASKAALAAYLRAVDEETARTASAPSPCSRWARSTRGQPAAMPAADPAGWIDTARLADVLLLAATLGPRARLREVEVHPDA